MKPYIICHMFASLDGRIDCAMTEHISGEEYYQALNLLNCQAEINGRQTSLLHFAANEPFTTSDPSPIEKKSFCALTKSGNYHVILDTMGKLRYNGGRINDKDGIVIVSQNAPKEYVRYLEQEGISWIAVGEKEIDFKSAMEILHDEFGVKRAVVTGGGHINGAFLQKGLLNEVSMMYGAGIDGRKGWAAAFDGIEDQAFGPVKLKLQSVQQMDNQVVWLRYTCE